MKTGRTTRQLQRLSLYVEITPLFPSIVLCPHSPHTERINPRGSSPVVSGANASLTRRHCCPFLGSHHQLRTFQLSWPPLRPSIGLIINIPPKENKAEPR